MSLAKGVLFELEALLRREVRVQRSKRLRVSGPSVW